MDYEYSKLKEKLKTEEGGLLYKRIQEEYEVKYAHKPILALTYSKYKLIYKTGNRTEFENEFFERRQRLTLLQILAIGDDTYLDALEDLLSAICDEFTWLLPAHSFMGNEGVLDRFDYTRVDLFGSETGFYLSETISIFGDKLSVDIRERVKRCVKEKILDNFESRTCWWEREDIGCNWTAVCACGVGISYLYLYPERFITFKERIFALFKQYISLAFTDDGVCVEGAHYYNYGVGFMLYFCDVYQQKFGELPSFIMDEKIQKMFTYHQNSIVDGWGIPFADTSLIRVEHYDVFELVAKKLFCDYTLPNYNYAEQMIFSREALIVRVLDCIGKFNDASNHSVTTAEFSRFYEQSQIFSRKRGNYLLFAKGGNNNELHNHNDVGCFAFYANGNRIIADIGYGEYTYEYSEDSKETRYGEKIFCCGSCSHSVPIVGDVYQTYGENTQAKLLSRDENGVKFEIANAYKLNDSSLTVEYACMENGLTVLYEYKGEKRALTFRFISDFQPKTKNGKVFLGDVEVVCDKAYKLVWNWREWKTYSGVQGVWVIDFIVDESEELQVRFDFMFNNSEIKNSKKGECL